MRAVQMSTPTEQEAEQFQQAPWRESASRDELLAESSAASPEAAEVATDVSAAPTLSRETLRSVLDLGPPYLLRNVPVEPVFEGGRFVGFQVRAFFNGHPRSAQGPREGDIIVSVNGRRIERPEDLFETWQAMRSASSLQVDLIRDQRLMTLSWVIVD